MRTTRCLIALLLLTTVGCRYGEAVLGESERPLDPRPAFGEATTAGGEDDISPCDAWGEDEQPQVVNLGTLFEARKPETEGWTVETATGATILVRQGSQSSGGPTAFIYAERIDSEASGGPGAAIRSFEARVDRRLAVLAKESSPPVAEEASSAPETSVETSKAPAGASSGYATPSSPSPSLTPDLTPGAPAASQVSGASSEQAVPSVGTTGSVAEVRREISGGLSRPSSGYSSERGSFSGWKWIGRCLVVGSSPEVAARNQLKPFLRLSRTHGTWQRPSQSLAEPAIMVLGTVTLPDRSDFGFHLAIVCIGARRCDAAPELLRFVGSLRVASTDAGTGAGLGSVPRYFEEMAEEVGILLPGSLAP